MTTTLERPEAAAPLPDLGPPAHGRRGLGGWATRWRTALRIAWRNARRNRLSTAIATTMIALPVAAAVFLLSFLVSTTGTPLDWYHASYGTNTQAYLYDIGCNGCEMPQRPAPYDPAVAEAGDVPPPGLGRPPTTEDIEAVRPGIDIVEGVGGVVTVTSESGEVDLGRRRAAALPVERLGEVYTARTGRLPAGPTEAALHWQEAERLGVEEGDVVMVDDVPLLVTGVLDSRNRPSASIVTVTGALDLASSGWYVLGETPVTWDDVDALNTIGLRVESPETVTNPNPDGVAYETGGADLQVIGVGAAVAAIALIEAVLLVGPAFAVSARRQTRQLALLVAAGGSRRDARRVVVASGVVIGIVAALAGAVVGLGAVLAMWWVQSRTWTPLVGLRAPWWAIAGPMAFAVVLGLLASLVPARTVARLDVTAALAGRRAEARPRRGVPWVGVGLGVAGLVVAVVGAIGGQMLLVVCGIVALELGTVLAVGGILSLGARLGPRFGVAGRFAVRDAVRQRSRTVPAVASVAAAVAAVVAGAVYVSTDAEMQRAMWQPGIGVGTIRIESASPFLPDEGEPTDMEATAEESIVNAVPLIEEQVPLEGWAYLRAVRTGAWYEDLGGTASNMTVRPALRPDQECPDDMFDSESEDPRCHWRYQDTSFQGLYSEEGVLVDDGSAISLLTAPGADEAAAALAAGSVVVPDPDYIWEDGTVHLEIARFDPIDESSEREVETLVLPAHASELSVAPVILPPSVAESAGLETTLVGAVARPGEPYSTDWADRVRGERAQAWVHVQGPFTSSAGTTIAAIVGVAAIVALAATWLSVALAGAETRPDLATFAAVGAGPRLTRRVAAAQAAVVAVLGVGLGVLLGLMLGWVLGTVTTEISWSPSMIEDAGGTVPGVTVPWLWVLLIALVLPALAVAGAWLTAPRRLPLVRRIAQ
ncbi:FtsX-like permease family protein [Salana multivorans]